MQSFSLSLPHTLILISYCSIFNYTTVIITASKSQDDEGTSIEVDKNTADYFRDIYDLIHNTPDDDEVVEDQRPRVEIYSLSESLEFVIDHYKKAKIIQQEVNSLLKKSYDTMKKDELFSRTMHELQYTLEILMEELDRVIKLKHEMTQTEFLARIDRLKNAKNATVELYFDKMIEIHESLPNEVEVSEINAANVAMREEVDKFSDMTDEFMKHATALEDIVGVMEDVTISKTTLDDVDAEEDHSWVSISVLENLLAQYQKLEGLKNLILLEKDEKQAMEMQATIDELEQSIIPGFLQDNKTNLKKYIEHSAGIVFRNLKKLMELDDTVVNLEVIQDEYVRLGDMQTLMLDKFNTIVSENEILIKEEL